MLSSIQTTETLARLKPIHSMLTLDEAVTMVTGRKPPPAHRIRQMVRDEWFDASDTVAARRRKLEGGVDDGELIVTISSLELFLMRCRKAGFIPELGFKMPYYQLPGGDIRLLAADLRATLKGEPRLEVPGCIAELRKAASRFEPTRRRRHR